MLKLLCKTRLLFLFLFIAASFNSVKAQPYLTKFDNFSFAKDARIIYQDSRGYLWFGTTNGLFRYDGNINSVHSYFKNSNVKNSISNNNIWGIVEDKDSTCLWIATDVGLNKYNYQSDDFDVFTNSSSDKNSISGNEVMALAKDINGDLWLGVSDYGLNKVVHINGQYNFKRYENILNQNQSFPLRNVWYLAFDKNNYCWAGNAKQGLCVFNASLPDDKIVYRKINSTTIPATNDNKIQCLYYDKYLNGIWLLSNDGMLDLINYKASPLDETLTIYHLKDSLFKKTKSTAYYLKNIKRDNSGLYWLGHSGGGVTTFKLNMVNEKPDIYIQNTFKYSIYSNDSIISDEINYFLEDKADNIWISTQLGISRHRNSRYLFQQGLSHNVFEKFLAKNVYQIKTDPNANIWIGMGDTDAVYLFQNNQLRSFNLTNKSTAAVHDFLFCSNGNLIIAGMPGLYFISKEVVSDFVLNGKRPATIISKNCDTLNYIEGIGKNTIYFSCLLETNNHKTMVGTMNGLFVLDPINLRAKKVSTEITNSISDRIRDLIELKGNRLLVGTDDGLYCYDVNTMQPIPLANLFINNNGKFDNHVTSFASVSTDEILIGTDDGLYKLNCKHRAINQIGPNDISIKKVVYDTKSKNIYFSSYNGIYRIDSNGVYMNVNSFDGLFSDNFNEGAGAILPNHVVAFGSILGLNSFFADSISPAIFQTPALSYTDLLISGVSVFKNDSAMLQLKNQFLKSETIKLAYNQIDIVIAFQAMNFLSPEKNFYQYKLRNADTTWIDNGHAANLLLKLAPIRNSWFFPGTYHIKLRSRTPGGNWVYVNKPLLVSIKPVWNKSLEFLSILALLFLAAVIYIVRYFAQQKLKEQIREQEKLLAIERERNRISEDLHDDLGAGLSSIAMMTGVMKDLVTDDESKETAEDVSTEANELVGRMREIIWSMNSKNDTLENLISYLDEYSSKYLSKNKIKSEVNVAGVIPQKNIRADKRENIFLVFKETLHNIVKYAASPLVAIDVTIDKNKLTINVFDNGKGFDINNIGRFGNGLTNMKQRIEKVGGLYNISSAPGNGTRTQIEVYID